MKIIYLNTDLVLKSRQDLTPLLESFGPSVSLMYQAKIRGSYVLSVETASASTNPDKTINQLCEYIEALPKREKTIWKNCSARLLDVGFSSGTTPQDFQTQLNAATLLRAAKLGLDVAVTIYPIEKVVKKQKKASSKKAK